MKTTAAISKIPVALGRESVVYEDELASHLRRALTAEQELMRPDDVLTWADEILDRANRDSPT